MQKIEIKFLQTMAILLFVVLLYFVAEGVIRSAITVNQATIATTSGYHVKNNLFETVYYNEQPVGYILTAETDTLLTGVVENDDVISTCNIVTCDGEQQIKQIIQEWESEILNEKTLFNINRVQQLYQHGYINYILADTEYKLGNTVYKIPFWSINIIKPVDITADGTYTKVCVTTLQNKTNTYNADVQISVLNDFFAMYNLQLSINEFMSITDNGLTYQPNVQFAYTAAEYFEFDSETGTIIEYRSQDKGAPTEVYIPEKLNGTTVRAIGPNAFYKYNNTNQVTLVEMPDTVTEIGSKAFLGCTNLQQIKLSRNLQIVGEEAFAGCTSLVRLELPNVLTKLSEKAFYGCTALVDVVGIDKLTEVYANTFDKCSKLDLQLPKDCIIHT